MFWSAHIVVKAVMLGLFLASLWCWTIIFDKTRLFRSSAPRWRVSSRCSGRASRSRSFTPRSRARRNTGAAALFVAAMREWKRSFQQAAGSFRGLHARIDKVLDVSIAREVERLESNLLVLATVASAGPFIGLFGTVFGIMNSFQSIAASKNTSLAVVAPGIAEALLATAIGLFAAIPALIAYNKFQGDVAKAQARLESFADEFSSILSRQIDHHLSTERATRPEGARRWAWRSAAARKSSRGRRGVPRYGAMADINMTPFIDVMLVLLIIFMVAAPLLTTGVSVDLPQASASALNVDKKPIAVSLNDQGQLFLMDQPIADADLVPKLQAASQNDTGAAHLSARLEGRALRPGGADHGVRHRGGLQEGGAGHRADEPVAGSGFGRTAVILGLGGLEHAPWRPGFAPDPGIRRGAEIRGQPGSDPRRDRLRDPAQPDHERREGRQARAPSRLLRRTETPRPSRRRPPRPSRRPNCARPTSPSPRRPPPKPEPAPPPKPEPAAAAEAGRRRRSPTAQAAGTAEGPDAGRSRSPTRSPSSLDHDKTDAKPTQAYDPNAIAKLIAPKASSASSAARQRRRPRPRRACPITTRRACRCRWPPRSTPG